MTCGIYKLNFESTDKVYIGQSVDIEDRFIKHRSSFKRKVASPKLQAGVNEYGMPSVEILIECPIPELNSMENEAIDVFNSVDNGFNTLREAGNPTLYGDKVGTSKHSNEQYILVVRLLVQKSPSLTKKEISELTGVSIYIVRHIAALESHHWIKEVYPELYDKLETIRKEQPYYTGNQYPKIIAPDGSVYEVTHVTKFAKEHMLLQPKLTELLRGTRNMHKGWTRYEG